MKLSFKGKMVAGRSPYRQRLDTINQAARLYMEASEDECRQLADIVVREFESYLRARAAKRVTPRYTLSDLMQEGRLGLLYALSKYDGRALFTTFCPYYIEGNMLKSMDPNRFSYERHHAIGVGVRSERYEDDAESTGSEYSVFPTPTPDFSPNVLTRSALDPALATLSERERTVIRRFYMEGYNFQEIAAQMGVAANTVNIARDSGLRKLRSYFEHRSLTYYGLR